MLVKLFVLVRQLNVMYVRSIVLVNSTNHQLLTNLSINLRDKSVTLDDQMSVTPAVLADLSNSLEIFAKEHIFGTITSLQPLDLPKSEIRHFSNNLPTL